MIIFYLTKQKEQGMNIFDQAWGTAKGIKHVSTRFCDFKAQHIGNMPKWMDYRIRQNIIDLVETYKMILCALEEK